MQPKVFEGLWYMYRLQFSLQEFLPKPLVMKYLFTFFRMLFYLFAILLLFPLQMVANCPFDLKYSDDELVKNNLSKSSEAYIAYLSKKAKLVVRDDPTTAYHIGEKLIAFGESNSIEQSIAKGKQIIARASMLKVVNDKSFKLAREALEYAKKIGADSVYLDCINILGIGHLRKKEFHKVFEYNQLGLNHALTIGNWEKRLKFTTNAGVILSIIKEYEKALMYFDKSLELLLTQPENLHLAQIYMNKADLYYNQEKYDFAKKEVLNSFKILENIDDKLTKTEGYIILGKVNLEHKDLKSAQNYFTKALKLLEGREDAKRIVETNLGLAKVQLLSQNYAEAKDFGFLALELANKSNYNNGKLEASLLMHKINTALDDFKEANNYLVSYTKLSDSLEVATSETKLKVSLAEMNFKNTEQTIRLESNRNLKRQKYILYTTITLLLILLTITFFVIHNEKQQKSLNKELHLSKVELEERSKVLHQSNENKTKLFSIISHDLKGPMNSFKDLVSMINRGKLSKDDLLHFAPKFENSLDGLLFTLNNLLTWGKTQMDGIKTIPAKINMGEIVNANISLLSEVANKKSIELMNEFGEDELAWADKDQVDIVLRNLLSNAIKFTPINGTINVGCNTQDKMLEIYVKDSGVGMSPDVQKHIFENDTNFTTYGTKGEKGTGLGLTVCKEMVENNGGEIWVDSQEGSGSCFYFTIPKYSNQNLS